MRFSDSGKHVVHFTLMTCLFWGGIFFCFGECLVCLFWGGTFSKIDMFVLG